MPLGHENSFLVMEKSFKSHGKSLLKKNGHPGLTFGDFHVNTLAVKETLVKMIM